MEARGNGSSGGAGAGGPVPALASPARPDRVVLDLAGVILLAAGLWILVRTALFWPLGGYDEGLLLTDAMLVLRGKAPYRDFYSNYPPGIFLTIAALWKVFGVRPEVLRFLGLAIHLGLSAVAGRLAGRAGGRRFSWLAAGLVLAWTALLGNVPFAWMAGLLSALVFAERLGAAGPAGASWPVAAGLALGAVGAYRHDLLVYLCVALVALAAARAIRLRAFRRGRDELRAMAPAAAAAAAILALVFVPALARAGIARVAGDLYFDQVRHVMPSRLLPLPDVLRAVPAFGLQLPALAVQPFEGAVVLTLAGPLLGALAVLVSRRATGRFDSGLLATTALSLAVLPQLLGRTDVYHALYTVTPALVLASVLAEHGTPAAPPGLRAAAAGLLAAALALPAVPSLGALLRLRPDGAVPGPSPRYGRLPETSAAVAEARRAVFAFLDARGRPGDPVFVGSADHRAPLMSEMELYFLADRTGSTRYMQFDPGIVGRRDVQEEMVRELEAVRPAAAVLSRMTLRDEPRRPGASGATLLDEYLASRYRLAGTAGPYLLLERR
ncbi:MAG: hypothetical protein U0529_02675 [Thermoanaerobaculia bacterium]